MASVRVVILVTSAWRPQVRAVEAWFDEYKAGGDGFGLP